MALLKDSECDQLRQLVKACLLEISKLKMELKKSQNETSVTGDNKALSVLEEESQSKLQEKEKEINDLHELLEKKNQKLEELEIIKYHFNALTAKPKPDLTSFQSQVYQLLPIEEDTLDNHYGHITEIGFSELSSENFEHVIRNLERKGYFESYEKDDKTYWKKIDK
jgi:ABC-type Fe3+-citrate transport system substrate-binding protein